MHYHLFDMRFAFKVKENRYIYIKSKLNFFFNCENCYDNIPYIKDTSIMLYTIQNLKLKHLSVLNT